MFSAAFIAMWKQNYHNERENDLLVVACPITIRLDSHDGWHDDEQSWSEVETAQLVLTNALGWHGASGRSSGTTKKKKGFSAHARQPGRR